MKLFSLLAAAAFAVATPTPGGPDKSKVYVESISYGGTGCPQGTVGQSISDDRTVFTLIFDSFVASIGPGVPVTENRKNCQINVNLHIPQGWSYTIADVTYRGYVQLAAGHTATQSSLYYFSGSTQQARASTNFSGPAAKDYTIGDRLDLNALVWCECNAVVPVNINSQVRIVGDASKQGQITTDSIDGKVTHIYGLQWKQC